ncbi:hypothetical protein ACQCSX_04285 [Pseudarthrobacter sp. P1]|uniref:hypothetical protein n=1 Tax=Pseudarthrobacter sp. P1 TaxID=3418418 RepID=UPI003CEFB8EF
MTAHELAATRTALAIARARYAHLAQWPASINPLHGYDLRISAEQIQLLEAIVNTETTTHHTSKDHS